MRKHLGEGDAVNGEGFRIRVRLLSQSDRDGGDLTKPDAVEVTLVSPEEEWHEAVFLLEDFYRAVRWIPPQHKEAGDQA